MVFCQRNDAAQFRIEALEAIEVNGGEAFGGDLAGLDPTRELRDGGEGDVRFAGRKRCVRIRGALVVIAFFAGEAGRGSREKRIPNGGGCEIGFESYFARAGSALVERSHGLTPVARSLGAVGFGHLDLDEFLRFRKGFGGDSRADGLSSAESWRRAGSLLVLCGRWSLFRVDGECCAYCSHGADCLEVSP